MREPAGRAGRCGRTRALDHCGRRRPASIAAGIVRYGQMHGSQVRRGATVQVRGRRTGDDGIGTAEERRSSHDRQRSTSTRGVDQHARPRRSELPGGKCSPNAALTEHRDCLLPGADAVDIENRSDHPSTIVHIRRRRSSNATLWMTEPGVDNSRAESPDSRTKNPRLAHRNPRLAHRIPDSRAETPTRAPTPDCGAAGVRVRRVRATGRC